MAALNINEYYGCFSCEAADEHGNGCRHGLLFPVLLAMGNKRSSQTINSRRNNYGSKG